MIDIPKIISEIILILNTLAQPWGRGGGVQKRLASDIFNVDYIALLIHCTLYLIDLHIGLDCAGLFI